MYRPSVLAVAILASCASVPEPARVPRVGAISVTTDRVYNHEEAERGMAYRAANAVAVPTREEFVRKLLLLHEGDAYDPAKVLESERNLLSLDFLKTVTITPSEHDGTVDLDVATQDAFTTSVGVDYSNEGGRSVYDFEVTQKNLFGHGGALGVVVANLRERKTNSIDYLQPSAFGAYWNTDLFYANSSDGGEQRVAVTRPLFSYATPLTLDSLADHLKQDARVYQNGVVASLFAQDHRALRVLPGFPISAKPGTTIRALAGIDWLQDRFTPIHGIAPDDRDFRFAEAGIDRTSLRYIGIRHVNLGLKQEDFTLGTHSSVLAGVTVNGVWRFTLDEAYGLAFNETSFVQTRLSATTRVRADNQNAILSSDTFFVKEWASRYPNTIVVRNRLDLGRDVDRDLQFFADGQNGLRAYPNFAFAGTRRFVFNIEDRLFLGRELLQVFEPSLAAFTDIGTATNASLLNEKMHSDFGVGLRLSFPRFESAMLRFDVAYAATESPLSKRGFVFSFATSQAF